MSVFIARPTLARQGIPALADHRATDIGARREPNLTKSDQTPDLIKFSVYEDNEKSLILAQPSQFYLWSVPGSNR